MLSLDERRDTLSYIVMGRQQRPWTRCHGCQRCEYNDILLQADLVCKGCSQKVELYAKRSSSGSRKSVSFANDQDDGGLVHPKGILREPSPGRKGKGRDPQGGASKASTTADLLRRALESTADPNPQASLKIQVGGWSRRRPPPRRPPQWRHCAVLMASGRTRTIAMGNRCSM